VKPSDSFRTDGARARADSFPPRTVAHSMTLLDRSLDHPLQRRERVAGDPSLCRCGGYDSARERNTRRGTIDINQAPRTMGDAQPEWMAASSPSIRTMGPEGDPVTSALSRLSWECLLLADETPIFSVCTAPAATRPGRHKHPEYLSVSGPGNSWDELGRFSTTRRKFNSIPVNLPQVKILNCIIPIAGSNGRCPQKAWTISCQHQVYDSSRAKRS